MEFVCFLEYFYICRLKLQEVFDLLILRHESITGGHLTHAVIFIIFFNLSAKAEVQMIEIT